METYLVWLAAGFVLVIAELVTGTFFLLVLGSAAFAGSATAWFGLGFWGGALWAAAGGVAGGVWWQRHPKSLPLPRHGVARRGSGGHARCLGEPGTGRGAGEVSQYAVGCGGRGREIGRASCRERV